MSSSSGHSCEEGDQRGGIERTVNRSSNKSVLLSVDEILGLVTDDADPTDETGFASHGTPTTSSPPLASDRVASADAANVPPPPMRNWRSGLWYETDPRDGHGNDGGDPDDEGDDDCGNCEEPEELSHDGSVATNAPVPPSGSSPSVGTHRRIATNHTTEPHGREQQHRIQGISTTTTRTPATGLQAVDVAPPRTTPIHTSKKSSSRFEIFEDKLREEEETTGILL